MLACEKGNPPSNANADLRTICRSRGHEHDERRMGPIAPRKKKIPLPSGPDFLARKLPDDSSSTVELAPNQFPRPSLGASATAVEPLRASSPPPASHKRESHSRLPQSPVRTSFWTRAQVFRLASLAANTRAAIAWLPIPLDYLCRYYKYNLTSTHTYIHSLPAMGWLLYLAAMPAALVVFMHALSLVLPKGLAQLVHYYAFLLTAFFVMMSCAAYGVAVGCILRITGYGGLIQWTVARAAKWSMWAITGTTFRVTGSAKRNGGISGEDALKERPAVFVGNHQTYVIRT